MSADSTPASPARPRSMLFVSGEQVERFPKALVAGADLICIDLEDAVHPDRKAEARTQVLGWLQTAGRPAGGPQIALRLNGVRTAHGLRDAHALAESGVALDWLLLPKVEDAGDLQCADAWFGAQLSPRGGLVALLESPLGIERAVEIGRAGGRTAALMLGGADLSAELGAQFGWDGLLSARGRLVNAARAAGVQAWDVPHVDVKDLDALATETRRVRELGYDCKTAIHPAQIAVIHQAFAPTPAERAWAERVVAAIPEGHASGAILLDGRMVDAPLIRKARRIVALAAAAA